MGKVAFVTTGATAPFKELIEAALDAMTVSALADLGFDTLLVQHGAGLGKETYNSSLAALASASAEKGVSISGIEFSERIGDHITAADLVISHAGSGSILDALKRLKRLIVVVNDKLLDNHQRELAEELERQGYLLEATPRNLATIIPKAITEDFKPFLTQQGQALSAVLQEEIGIIS